MSVGFIYSSARTPAAPSRTSREQVSAGPSRGSACGPPNPGGIVVDKPLKFHRYIRHNRVLAVAPLLPPHHGQTATINPRPNMWVAEMPVQPLEKHSVCAAVGSLGQGR